MPIILPEISLLSSILPFCVVLSSNFALQIAFLIASPARQDQPPLSTHARKRRRRSMSPCARNTWEIPRMSCTNRSWTIVFLIFASAPERLLPNWRRKFCTHSDAKTGSLSTHSLLKSLSRQSPTGGGQVVVIATKRISCNVEKCGVLSDAEA